MSKYVIVTGASGNLGRSVVQKLHEEGFHVHAVIGPDDKNPYLFDALNASSINVSTYQLNLAKEGEVKNFFRQVCDLNNNIEAVIMLTGGYTYGNIREADMSSLERMITLNFYTVYPLVRELFMHWEKQSKSGRFIFAGARPALQHTDGKYSLSYALSKSLLFQLSDLINESGRNMGITSSVIVPSILDTRSNREAMPFANYNDWVPVEKVAEVILFLLSEAGMMLRENVVKVYNKA